MFGPWYLDVPMLAGAVVAAAGIAWWLCGRLVALSERRYPDLDGIHGHEETAA